LLPVPLFAQLSKQRVGAVNKFWPSLPYLFKPIAVAREPLWPGLRITSKLLLVA
jgi:hypothetical protein